MNIWLERTFWITLIIFIYTISGRDEPKTAHQPIVIKESVTKAKRSPFATIREEQPEPKPIQPAAFEPPVQESEEPTLPPTDEDTYEDELIEEDYPHTNESFLKGVAHLSKPLEKSLFAASIAYAMVCEEHPTPEHLKLLIKTPALQGISALLHSTDSYDAALAYAYAATLDNAAFDCIAIEEAMPIDMCSHQGKNYKVHDQILMDSGYMLICEQENIDLRAEWAVR